MHKFIGITNHREWDPKSKEYGEKKVIYINIDNIIEIQPGRSGYTFVRYWNGTELILLITHESPDSFIQRISHQTGK